jgi:gamma-glutamylcyclotransferase (GGCT)/AIG2-like uncharacterized protein YtfP
MRLIFVMSCVQEAHLINIFVYGSLMTTGCAFHLIAQKVRGVQPGEVKGMLVHTGEYPALLPSEEGVVSGQWLTLEAEALVIMDEWEHYIGPQHADNEYERIWICDLHVPMEGWVYTARS